MTDDHPMAVTVIYLEVQTNEPATNNVSMKHNNLLFLVPSSINQIKILEGLKPVSPNMGITKTSRARRPVTPRRVGRRPRRSFSLTEVHIPA